MIEKLSDHYSVKAIPWNSISGQSPQRSAYANGLSKINTEWISFIDIDEYIVPWSFNSINEYLEDAPDEAGAIALSWRCFGSSGLQSPDYEELTSSFVRCSNPSWENNTHFKTIARRDCVSKVHIHHVELSRGSYLNSKFEPLEMRAQGRMKEAVYGGIQINHYQSKTFEEFYQRMLRGNANFPVGHPQHSRNASLERFRKLDRNENEDQKIFKFLDGKRKIEAEMKKIIASAS